VSILYLEKWTACKKFGCNEAVVEFSELESRNFQKANKLLATFHRSAAKVNNIFSKKIQDI
jgi:hypothetical protein